MQSSTPVTAIMNSDLQKLPWAQLMEDMGTFHPTFGHMGHVLQFFMSVVSFGSYYFARYMSNW